MRHRAILAIWLAIPAVAETQPAAAPLDPVRAFVAEHAVGLDHPGLPTVRSLIRALATRDLFVHVERPVMAGWHRDPAARTAWLARLERLSGRIAGLRATAGARLLEGGEAAELASAERALHRMKRQDAAWREVYSAARPADYPFVLSGRQALALGVLDGCTTVSRTFCLLARSAGLEVRLVDAANLDELRRIWRPGRARGEGGVNGHKMALVRAEGQWHLVNASHFAPHAEPPYEIFAAVDGRPVAPETLPGTVLRFPSMQVQARGRSPQLVVTCVGLPEAEDLGEHSLEANLNLAVSGDPASPLCRNPALTGLLGAAGSGD
ncbi:MAG: hypothetical protein JXQ29_10835 [Planctomycetes bacterium]|nr:hypothetical protein [Planctomycetota bacterium]